MTPMLPGEKVYEYNYRIERQNQLREAARTKRAETKARRKARLKKLHAGIDNFRDYAQGGTSDAAVPDKGRPYHFVRRAKPAKPIAKTAKTAKGFGNEYADFLSSPTKRNTKKPVKRNEDDAGFDYLR